MTTYIVRRLLLMIPTMLGITVVCFLLCQFVPGGPVEQVISRIRAASSAHGASQRTISPEEVANIKAYLGFDKPIHVRYFIWLGRLLRFDLGNSYVYHLPVWNVIVSKMPISLFFGLTSFILSYAVSIPLGVWKAVKHHSAFDIATSAIVFAGYVIPGYALGILLIIFLGGGSYLAWFPISGVVSDNFEDLSSHGKSPRFSSSPLPSDDLLHDQRIRVPDPAHEEHLARRVEQRVPPHRPGKRRLLSPRRLDACLPQRPHPACHQQRRSLHGHVRRRCFSSSGSSISMAWAISFITLSSAAITT